MIVYIVDAQDYMQEGRAVVKVYARTETGEAFDFVVTGVPYFFYVGCDELPDPALRERLELFLGNFAPPCRAFRCPQHPNDFHSINREPCPEDEGCPFESQDQRVVGWSLSAPLKPFDIYREVAHPFLKVTLSRPCDIGRASSFLLKNVPCSNLLNRGVYDKLNTGAEYLLHGLGVSGFEWVAIPRCENGSTIDFKQLKRSDIQPPAPKMRSLVFDIEVLAKRYRECETIAAEYPVCVISAEFDGRITSFVLEADQYTGDGLQPHVEEQMSDRYEDQVLSPEEESQLRAKEEARNVKLQALREEWLSHNRATRTELKFDDERCLLTAFKEFMRGVDPDFLIGYNHRHYDIPYLLRRATKLGVEGFDEWSRDDMPALFLTKATERQGRKKNVTYVSVPGVVVLDLKMVAEDTVRLDSYKLSSVLAHYELGSKGDVGYDQIWTYFYGSQETRAALVEYCEGDVHWTSRLESKFDQVPKIQAKCRVQRILGRDSTDRGLTYCLTTFLRSRLVGQYILPVREQVTKERVLEDGEAIVERVYLLSPAQATIPGFAEIHDKVVNKKEKYAGAYVFTPKPGLVTDCLATFDFASLYPNQARTENICPSTLIAGKLPQKNGETVFRFHFRKDVGGVLPAAYEYLISERKKIKEKLKQYQEGSDEFRALKAFENEVKLLANGLYGGFGAATSPICSFPVASSITAFGQESIRRVEELVTSEFNASIAYGDTDSLFVRLNGVKDVALGFEMAEKIKKRINKSLTGSLEMAFENLSLPTLLLAKKKYVKILRNSDGTIEKLKTSGLDNRSLCGYVSKTINAVFDMALVRNLPPSEVRRYLMRRGARICSGRASVSDLTFTKALTRLPIEYTSALPHVKAALQLMFEGHEVVTGDRISYLFANVNVCKEDQKKVAPFVVAKEIYLKDGYNYNPRMYADSLAQSLVVTCQMLVDCEITQLIKNHSMGIFKLKQVPRCGKGGMDGFIVQGGAQKRVMEGAVSVERETKRSKQADLRIFFS